MNNEKRNIYKNSSKSKVFTITNLVLGSSSENEEIQKGDIKE